MKVFITRKQYDNLLTNHFKWMEQHWSSMQKDWRVAGVFVSGPTIWIKKMQTLLDNG